MHINRGVIYYAAGIVTALTIFTFKRLLYPEHADRPEKLKAVFFGDSITQHGLNPEISGWLCHFANWWTRRVDVVNRGFSGYNSKWGALIVEQVVVPLRPDIVFVFFGANDAVDKTVGQHVPLSDYSANIKAIVTIVQERLPNVKLVLITPPPIWEPALEETNRNKYKVLHLDRTNERTLQYVQACLSLGQELGVPVVDAWTAMEGATDSRGDYLSDGLHLNARGNESLFSAARQVVLQRYPELHPEALPMHMLDWSRMIERDRAIARAAFQLGK